MFFCNTFSYLKPLLMNFTGWMWVISVFLLETTPPPKKRGPVIHEMTSGWINQPVFVTVVTELKEHYIPRNSRIKIIKYLQDLYLTHVLS